MSDLLRTLRRTHALLTQGWVQHASAVSATGQPVSPIQREAAGFALDGAIMRAAFEAAGKRRWEDDDAWRGLAQQAMATLAQHEPALVKALDGESALKLWNDAKERTEAEVLALLDRAIAAAQEGEDA